MLQLANRALIFRLVALDLQSREQPEVLEQIPLFTQAAAHIREFGEKALRRDRRPG